MFRKTQNPFEGIPKHLHSEYKKYLADKFKYRNLYPVTAKILEELIRKNQSEAQDGKKEIE